MTHHHLRFHLFHGIQRNANQDDDRGTTHGQVVHTGNSAESNGSKAMTARNNAPIKVILERIFCNIIRSRLSGTNARDGAVVLTKIIGHFNRIILNGYIEVSKHDNQNEIQYEYSQPRGGKASKKAFQKPSHRYP